MKKDLIQRCTVMTLLIVVLFTGFSQTAFTNILEKGYIQDLILKYVKEVYIDTTSEITLLDGAIQGMIEKLDPHSSYMPPITADEFNERIRGNFEGIGITFSILDHKITVIEVIKGGPSEAEGLKSRDKIVKIDGESALDFTADNVKERLRGHKGTKVTVFVERPGENKLLKFTITRDAVKLNSVSHAYMLDMKTGYIVVTKFTTKTDEDVLRALNKLDMQGMKQLVLDLRNNSGGSLEAAVNVVDFFISDGLIVETKGKRKRDNYKWPARKKPPYANIPMIV